MRRSGLRGRWRERGVVTALRVTARRPFCTQACHLCDSFSAAAPPRPRRPPPAPCRRGCAHLALGKHALEIRDPGEGPIQAVPAVRRLGLHGGDLHCAAASQDGHRAGAALDDPGCDPANAAGPVDRPGNLGAPRPALPAGRLEPRLKGVRAGGAHRDGRRPAAGRAAERAGGCHMPQSGGRRGCLAVRANPLTRLSTMLDACDRTGAAPAGDRRRLPEPLVDRHRGLGAEHHVDLGDADTGVNRNPYIN